MLVYSITDWDNAYANMPNVPRGDTYPDQWTAKAREFRSVMKKSGRSDIDIAYGSSERNRLDLFWPEGTAAGLLIIIHGGYWMRFDKSYFSHLAAGALARGWAVAMPAYDLCPSVTIPQITAQIGKALETAAEKVPGPVRLAGHSAGGHLASRMVCTDTPLSHGTTSRIDRVLSISGVHDLRPLLNLEMNETLRLDGVMAAAERPALLKPVSEIEIFCWAGAGERAEFLRNNALLANIWLGLGARTACVEEPDRHHLDVIEGLEKPDSRMLAALLG